MPPVPYIDRASVADANELMRRFGDDAGYEAAALADGARDRGNVVHYCRWRAIERLIVLLAAREVQGTVH